MEGAALRREREVDLMIAHAWHAATFGGLAQVGKLKGLSTYTGKKKPGSSIRNHASEAAAFFHALKASGADIDIKLVPREPA